MIENSKIEINTEKLDPFINGIKEAVSDLKQAIKKLEEYGVKVGCDVDDTEAKEKVKSFVEIKIINAQ